MRPVALSDDLAVGELPTRELFAVLAKAGFRSLLSVQPDGEVARLITNADAAAAAAAAGLAYAHVPCPSRRLSDEQTAAFARGMATLPRPIYACCYSGARAAAAWALAIAPVMAPGNIAAALSAAGFDTAALQPEIERRHAALPSSVGASAPVAIANTTPAAPEVSASQSASTTTAPVSAPAAVTAATRVIYPRAAGAGGFAVSG